MAILFQTDNAACTCENFCLVLISLLLYWYPFMQRLIHGIFSLQVQLCDWALEFFGDSFIFTWSIYVYLIYRSLQYYRGPVLGSPTKINQIYYKIDWVWSKTYHILTEGNFLSNLQNLCKIGKNISKTFGRSMYVCMCVCMYYYTSSSLLRTTNRLSSSLLGKY